MHHKRKKNEIRKKYDKRKTQTGSRVRKFNLKNKMRNKKVFRAIIQLITLN
jgi:hypothetical protein